MPEYCCKPALLGKYNFNKYMTLPMKEIENYDIVQKGLEAEWLDMYQGL